MDIESIGQYLKKYQKIIQQRGDHTTEILQVLNKYIPTEVTKEQIKISKKTVSLNVGASQKQVLFIYKQKILKELNLKNIDIIDIH
jgi:uncharacterized protein YqeY